MYDKPWNIRTGCKYGARKVEADGLVFDSRREYDRWCELKLLERAGEIRNLRRQVPYELIPAYWEGEGKNRKCIERAVSYRADFVYEDRDGKTHVQDSKGMRTKEYILKRKLMLHVHGIRIEEV